MSHYNSTHTIPYKGWNGAQHSVSDYNVFYHYNTSSDHDSASDFQEKSLEWLEYDQKLIDGEIKYERYSRCLVSKRGPVSSSNSRYLLHPSSCLAIYNQNTPLDKRHSFGSSRDHIVPSFHNSWTRKNSLHSCPEFSSDQLNVNSSKSKSNSLTMQKNRPSTIESSNHSTINYLASIKKEGIVT